MPLFLSRLPPRTTKIWNTSQTSVQLSMASDVCLSALCGRSSRSWRCAFQISHDLPRCGGLYRSAIAAVTPEGDSNWMAAEDLEPLGGRSSILARAEQETRAALRRVGLSAQELDGCGVRWRSGFPRNRGVGPASAFQRMLGARRVPDAFWTVRRPDACSRHRAVVEHHRINIAHLVLHHIWNDELSSRKREPKKVTNTVHDWRGRQD